MCIHTPGFGLVYLKDKIQLKWKFILKNIKFLIFKDKSNKTA